MARFLTVKEAARLIGKSPSSIRRIIYLILEKDQHPDRRHIHPTPEDAKALRLKGENFPWEISEELLRREVPEGARKSADESRPGTPPGRDGSAAVIEMLRRELDIKNRQIETQNELLKGLTERLREGNILIGSLQRQLSLPDAASRNRVDIVDAKPDAPKPEKGSDPAGQTAARRPGFWERLLRRQPA
jgi:hypothetical protein